MSGPDVFSFEFIQLDKQSVQPVYQQLIDEFSKGIQLGNLEDGMQLPGSRRLAQILGLNRNTVVKSLFELEVLGWVKILPNKGTFIVHPSPAKYKVEKFNKERKFPSHSPFSIEKSLLFHEPKEDSLCSFSFNDGQVDPRLVELKIPAKIYLSVLKRRRSIVNLVSFEQQYFLRKFVNYLRITRNLEVDSSHILICRSNEMALQLISRVLFCSRDIVGMSDLSYYKTNMLFQSNGIQLLPIPSDEQGIQIEAVRKLVSDKKMKAIFLSTHHQYPTTASLSEQRKIELNHLAEQHGILLIESSTHYDFYYGPRAETSLASQNHYGNILYTGEFGEELAPGFRFSYLIGPADFIEEAKKHQSLFESNFDPLLLQSLGEMIAEGEISRLQKKHRKIYQTRRDCLRDLLLQYFGNEVEIVLPKTGLAVWVKWKSSINLFQLRQDAEQKGLGIPLSLLYQNKAQAAIRLGFGDKTEEELKLAIKILFEAYRMQEV